MLIYAKPLILVKPHLESYDLHTFCPPNIFICRVRLVEYSRTQGLLTLVADDVPRAVGTASCCMTTVVVEDQSWYNSWAEFLI